MSGEPHMPTPDAVDNQITITLDYHDMAELWAQAAQTGTHPRELAHRYISEKLGGTGTTTTVKLNIDSEELYNKLLTHIRRNRP